MTEIGERPPSPTPHISYKGNPTPDVPYAIRIDPEKFTSALKKDFKLTPKKIAKLNIVIDYDEPPISEEVWNKQDYETRNDDDDPSNPDKKDGSFHFNVPTIYRGVVNPLIQDAHERIISRERVPELLVEVLSKLRDPELEDSDESFDDLADEPKLEQQPIEPFPYINRGPIETDPDETDLYDDRIDAEDRHVGPPVIIGKGPKREIPNREDLLKTVLGQYLEHHVAKTGMIPGKKYEGPLADAIRVELTTDFASPPPSSQEH